jgi:hypothetical protein
MNEYCKQFSNESQKEQTEDFLKITELARPLIYNTAGEIVKIYKMELFSQPADYIIPAIWGAKKGGEIDATQQKIYMQFIPVYNDLLKFFQCDELNASQEFAIGFLVRELLISKIAYMVDGIRNMAIQKMCRKEQDPYIINHIEAVGSA